MGLAVPAKALCLAWTASPRAGHPSRRGRRLVALSASRRLARLCRVRHQCRRAGRPLPRSGRICTTGGRGLSASRSGSGPRGRRRCVRDGRREAAQRVGASHTATVSASARIARTPSPPPGRSSVRRMLRVVALPARFGPSKPKMSPGRTESSIPARSTAAPLRPRRGARASRFTRCCRRTAGRWTTGRRGSARRRRICRPRHSSRVCPRPMSGRRRRSASGRSRTPVRVRISTAARSTGTRPDGSSGARRATVGWSERSTAEASALSSGTADAGGTQAASVSRRGACRGGWGGLVPYGFGAASGPPLDEVVASGARSVAVASYLLTPGGRAGLRARSAIRVLDSAFGGWAGAEVDEGFRW